MGTHPIFESDFDCLTECHGVIIKADPDLVPVDQASIRWVRISQFIQARLAWGIHKEDQLDQWVDNRRIRWVRDIRQALVVEDPEDHKWAILQITIKWLQTQTKWGRRKVKWDKIWEHSNRILMIRYIN